MACAGTFSKYCLRIEESLARANAFEIASNTRVITKGLLLKPEAAFIGKKQKVSVKK
jgi:hypothetical protein